MPASITREEDPPLAAFVAEDDIGVAGDYDPVYFSDDFMVFGYSLVVEDDPPLISFVNENDPPPLDATPGPFDLFLFDPVIFDTVTVNMWLEDDPATATVQEI